MQEGRMQAVGQLVYRTRKEYSAAALMNIVAPAIRVKATSKAVASPPIATDSSNSGAANALTPNAREVADRKPKAAACWSLLKRKPAVLLLLLLAGAAGSVLGVVFGSDCTVSVWDSD